MASDPVAPSVDVRRADERFHTEIGWLDSYHSFSFGGHQDPTNTHHGLLLVLNDDVVAPHTGFGQHPHRDMEIVTWVVRGRLTHRDTLGSEGVIRPGHAQRMSAGHGIRHSEMNEDDEPVRLIQMWVVPDTPGIEPSYEQRDLSSTYVEGAGWVAVASGQGHEGAVRIHQAGAVLHAANLGPDEELTVPDAPYTHLFVVFGAVSLQGGVARADVMLDEGDAARLTFAGGPTVRAGEDGAELLVWATDADLADR